MNGLIGIAGVVAILLGLGAVIGMVQRGGVSFRWLVIAAAFVVFNDALLTDAYGRLPDVISGDWNWQGKLLALSGSLAVAGLPIFGWRACGLTLKQAPGSLKSALAVSLIYVAFFIALALVFPNEPTSAEVLAFQLTLPGIEEETFYRGVLLLMLARAFPGQLPFLGVDWRWGAILSSVLFGLAHAFGFSHGHFNFEPLTFVLTGVPSLIGVWLAMRTRSLVLPILLHNFGNMIMLLL